MRSALDSALDRLLTPEQGRQIQANNRALLNGGRFEYDYALLPVERLSPSSIVGLLSCPERWRRDRIMGERRPTSGGAIFGSAFHRACAHNFRQKIDSHEDMDAKTMRALTGTSFEEVVKEESAEGEIVWDDAKPNDLQAEVIGAVVGNDKGPGYLQALAPSVQPVASERWVEVPLPIGIPLVSRIDVETDDGRIIDLKTSGKAKTQVDLDKDTQAASYLWARREEGQPAREFGWQVAIRTKTPRMQELQTTRTDGQLLGFERLVQMTADTILSYMERFGPEGPWPGTSPLSWWCSGRQCSYFASCPSRGGGGSPDYPWNGG